MQTLTFVPAAPLFPLPPLARAAIRAPTERRLVRRRGKFQIRVQGHATHHLLCSTRPLLQLFPQIRSGIYSSVGTRKRSCVSPGEETQLADRKVNPVIVAKANGIKRDRASMLLLTCARRPNGNGHSRLASGRISSPPLSVRIRAAACTYERVHVREKRAQFPPPPCLVIPFSFQRPFGFLGFSFSATAAANSSGH